MAAPSETSPSVRMPIGLSLRLRGRPSAIPAAAAATRRITTMISKGAGMSDMAVLLLPLLLRAGELTPVEKAERRVLILSDPGRGPGAMRVSGPIFCGMQLLLPGEKAPAHRHTPSAARVVIEGEGAYTIVNGEKCMMEP